MSTDPDDDDPLAAPAAPSEGLPLRLRPASSDAPPPLTHRRPFDAAEEALLKAAAARGVAYEPPQPASRDPMAKAREALARAEDALRHAQKGGAAGIAREEGARAQLEALKGEGTSPSAPKTEAPAAGPRKRTL